MKVLSTIWSDCVLTLPIICFINGATLWIFSFQFIKKESMCKKQDIIQFSWNLIRKVSGLLVMCESEQELDKQHIGN